MPVFSIALGGALGAVTRYGLDQSDYIINSMNVKLQYANPSPVKFNSKNLSTSNG